MAEHNVTLDLSYLLGTPDDSGMTVTPTGGAAGNFTYKLVGVNAQGQVTVASTGVAITNGPTTLDGTHYNTIDPTAVTRTNVANWDIYRTAGGATQGKIGRIAADGVATLDDEALVASGSTPGANTTGIGAATDISRDDHKMVVITGTFTATIQVQVSPDSGTTWLNEGSALTAAGFVEFAAPMTQTRVKMTAYTSGTPAATLAAEYEELD